MKKIYSKPLMSIELFKLQQPMLVSSYDGPANAPEADFGTDDSDIFDADVAPRFFDDIIVQ